MESDVDIALKAVTMTLRSPDEQPAAGSDGITDPKTQDEIASEIFDFEEEESTDSSEDEKPISAADALDALNRAEAEQSAVSPTSSVEADSDTDSDSDSDADSHSDSSAVDTLSSIDALLGITAPSNADTLRLQRFYSHTAQRDTRHIKPKLTEI